MDWQSGNDVSRQMPGAEERSRLQSRHGCSPDGLSREALLLSLYVPVAACWGHQYFNE